MLATARWELLQTSVGLKALMAVSGVLMSGWIFLHMAGNLLIFAGPEVLDGYGAALQGSPLVWVMRAGLIVCVGVHAGAAYVLTQRSVRARPQAYRYRLRHRETGVAARSMRLGGVLLLLFIAYHVAHIFGPLHASYEPGRVHHNFVSGMRDPFAATFYIAATIVLGLHLHHGVASVFQSLGQAVLFTGRARRASLGFALVVTVGFLAPCVAALAGWV